MCHFGGPSPPWSLPFDLCNAPLARFFFVTPNLHLHPVNAVTNNYMKHHCPSRLMGSKDPHYLDFLWSAIIGKRTDCLWGQRWEKYISYLRFPSAATSPPTLLTCWEQSSWNTWKIIGAYLECFAGILWHLHLHLHLLLHDTGLICS